ncbi:response regulator transcription factor [Cupriavidus sp. 2TAF22]|uniref:response regulator transcription factor n=1 Tax=unclassified Cupriavidus TaxID=2640874 RepID=UPI003F93C071
MVWEEQVVFVLDDDETMLWLYRELLRKPGLSIRTFASAQDFLGAYRPGPSECLICDLRMPEIGGLDVQRRLSETGISLPIIFVSGHAEIPSVVQAMKVGAFDFLEKPVDGERLVAVVSEALKHSKSLHASRIAMARRHARLALLSRREREVAELVAAGKSSRTISEDMGLSVRTVENHRARLTEKLEIGSVAELVRLLHAAA